jgi:hypothetical protein
MHKAEIPLRIVPTKSKHDFNQPDHSLPDPGNTILKQRQIKAAGIGRKGIASCIRVRSLA